MENCKVLGIDTHDILVAKGERTSTYLYITREDGDMALAVNDMSIYQRMTPEFISERMELLENSSLIVVDANLPEETIEAICRASKRPVFAEPVSSVKAVRFLNVLPFIHTITPNLMEAEVLAGRAIDPDNPDSLARAADDLLSEGVKQVVITLGAKGCFFSDGSVRQLVRPLPSRMINGNGAGDALFSGLATGFNRGMSLEDSVMLGMAAASITLETNLTNSPDLSFENARQRAKGNN